MASVDNVKTGRVMAINEFFSRLFVQGTLTEGDGSVHLTSSLRSFVL